MDYKKCGEPHVHSLPEGKAWHSEGDCTGNHIQDRSEMGFAEVLSTTAAFRFLLGKPVGSVTFCLLHPRSELLVRRRSFPGDN